MLLFLMKGDKNSDTIFKRQQKQWYNQVIKLGPEMRQNILKSALSLTSYITLSLVFSSLKYIIIVSYS